MARARLTVSDDGAGIEPASGERVFERFTRLDDARTRDSGGSGLGLAITRDIVHRHGGTIHLADSPRRVRPRTACSPLNVTEAGWVARACGRVALRDTWLMADTIRPATPADAPAIAALVDRAYERYLPRMDRTPAPMLDDYDKLVADGVVTVFEDGGRVCGVLVAWVDGDSFYVDNLAVDPDVHGRGVGRTLPRCGR